jgi:large subunit ribosomal protein L13
VYVIDAANTLVGRMATHAARAAMHGKTVRIVNCEQAAISGSKRFLVKEWVRRYKQGVPAHGPFVHRQPDRIVRRIVRGMLAHHNPRGRDAYARVLCYIGVPAELKDKEMVRLPEASVDTLPSGKYLTIAQLSKEIGGTWHE